mmetsp:Transcript_17713/g.49042  ORF Transcript_17713/g.49042 Transcript_17713/m.49042 type:complete len:693 (+) Transcript_17713:48-2126(+)
MISGAGSVGMANADMDEQTGEAEGMLDIADMYRFPSCANFADLQRVHGEANIKPIGMEWRDVSFGIGEKEILRCVSGRLEPGRILAVMGGSGHGKTTLMNVLSARQRTRGVENTSGSRQRISLSGDITLQGKVSKKADRRLKVAYVFQDIAMIETETPRECLLFSAYLRLPPTLEATQREAYVEGMLSALHLDGCADTCVGSAMRKGLSGGEQKRVSIGVELVSNPRMLFLDEPLSGLDAFNAYNVVRTLKLLAASGVPVMMTIHQPSSEIFDLLDDVLVLHEGEVCFHGPTSLLTEHFKTQGLLCPANYNPSDYVMFTMGRLSRDACRKVKDGWLGSQLAQDLRAGIPLCDVSGSESDDSQDGSESEPDSPSAWSVRTEAAVGGRAFFGQLGALMARDRRMVCRQLDQHITTHITMLVVALVYGWFFFKNGIKEESMNFLPNCLPDHYQPAACGAYFAAHMSVISLVSINMMFTSLGIAIDIIHRERPVLLRECAGGYYGIVAFFLSKCVFEVVLMSCSTAVTLLGTYFLVRLRGNMFIIFCEIMLMSFASSSLMYLLSAASRTREQAQTLALLPQVLQFAFSGLLVPAQMVPASLQWLKWCCPLFYGMGLVSVTEFQYVFDATHKCKADFGAEWATSTNCTSWSQRTEMLGYHDVHEGDWKNDLMMLCVLSVVLRFFAVLFLARNTKFAV